MDDATEADNESTAPKPLTRKELREQGYRQSVNIEAVKQAPKLEKPSDSGALVQSEEKKSTKPKSRRRELTAEEERSRKSQQNKLIAGAAALCLLGSLGLGAAFVIPSLSNNENIAASINSDGVYEGKYQFPAWVASPVVSDSKLGTIKGAGLAVDVYFLGSTKALNNSTGTLNDGKTLQFSEGDPIGYFSFFYTNKTNEPMTVSAMTLGYTPMLSSPQLDADAVIPELNADFIKDLGIVNSAGFYEIIAEDFVDKAVSWEPGEAYVVYGAFPLKDVKELEVYATVYEANKHEPQTVMFDKEPLSANGKVKLPENASKLTPEVFKLKLQKAK